MLEIGSIFESPLQFCFGKILHRDVNESCVQRIEEILAKTHYCMSRGIAKGFFASVSNCVHYSCAFLDFLKAVPDKKASATYSTWNSNSDSLCLLTAAPCML